MVVFVCVDFDSVIIRDTIHHGRLKVHPRTCVRTTIDGEYSSGDERAVVRCQEQRGACEIDGLTHTPYQLVTTQSATELRLSRCIAWIADERGRHGPWTEGGQ